MALTNAQMLAIINVGGTIGYRGSLLRAPADVPTDVHIASDAQLVNAPVSLNAAPVVLRQNAGFSAPGQSIKNYTGSVATSASLSVIVPLETVTAGKTYVITDIYISSNTSTQFEARVQANGVDIFRGWCKGDTAPIALAGLESQPNASASQAVTLLIPPIAGAPFVSFFFGGFEF